MGNVRTFSCADLGEVSKLWARVFAPQAALSMSSLERYMEEVFVSNPWSHRDLPSFVYEDKGEIVGFLGVLPRRMDFSGKVVTVAVASQLMLAPEKPRPFAALELIRRFFTGP
ncbi:MAG TPA: GNAT family N-acetyltransferase, partial [Terriglobia bacterium]|nr:GNAT family N-acetyltransferase [Terriglobia bacterium]